MGRGGVVMYRLLYLPDIKKGFLAETQRRKGLKV
jgi:hypothetical protein